MLVAWDWLSQYVQLDMSPEELALKLALSGLNHESTTEAYGKTVIDLEVTSNRGDCLSHIGIAREVAALFNRTLSIPNPQPEVCSLATQSIFKVHNHFQEGCPRYTARIIQGVRVGPSPDWLAARLRACGINTINNIVDITNYVMLECGQPLHAFDFDRISGGTIQVRKAFEREEFVAIDHRKYVLNPSMVVIADRDRAVALGGVMGGEQSEVSEATVNVLIEAADFTPLSIRRTARKLRLHSPSSYRYERRVDPAGLDWASRRCCQWILELAGGKLTDGLLDTASDPGERPAVELRRAQISRILGIEVDWEEALRILEKLGCKLVKHTQQSASLIPPTWRHDLPREIDLIEEIARVYGYDKIPENVSVPITPSAKRPKDVLFERVRGVLLASGYDEALTPSVITRQQDEWISPWTDEKGWVTQAPLLEGATHLRRTLIGSLLAARYYNQTLSNHRVHLFETSVIYLPDPLRKDLPHEQVTLAMLGSNDLRQTRGAMEEILFRVTGNVVYNIEEVAIRGIRTGTALRFSIDGSMLGWIGLLDRSIRDQWKLDGDITLAELNLDLLLKHLQLTPTLKAISPFPAITRDLNMIVEEEVRWSDFEGVVRSVIGPLLSTIEFREIYRDTKKDGERKKRILFGFSLQSGTHTLTSGEADEAVARVVSACEKAFSARLLL